MRACTRAQAAIAAVGQERKGERPRLVAPRPSWASWGVAAYTQQTPREASYTGARPPCQGLPC